MADLMKPLQKLLKEGARRARRATGRLRTPRALFIYHPDYQGPESEMIDPRRPQRIVNYLRREGAMHAGHLRKPLDVTVEQLARIHSLDYLERLGRPEEVQRICAQGDQSADADRLLQQQRCMVAGTVMAARLAAQPWGTRRPVVNLGGGLHHARADQGSGFCLFNDVAVAIAQLRADGFTGRVMVIDLDLHHGDGTRSIFARDASVLTFSIHAQDWDDAPALADVSLPLGLSVGDARYMEALRQNLPKALLGFKPDLIFYVGGVDIAEDDRLGNWRVSHEGIFARDKFVLSLIGDRPLVWTLAGGYGPEAWRHSARSLAWLTARLGEPIPSGFDRELRYFRHIARHLDPHELTEGEGDIFDFREEDVYGTLAGSRASTRLLGYYSRYGVEIALQRYGIQEIVRQAGYARTRVEMELDHPTGEMVRLVSDDGHRDILIEAVLRPTLEQPPFQLLYLEWLLMQHPRSLPSPERPLLPGQDHPGLGGLRQMIGMLLMACERLGMDGLAFRPAHYHVAAIARTWLRFADPVLEARYLAVSHSLEGLPLGRASKLVHQGAVVEVGSGEPYDWVSEMMVMPLTPACKQAYQSAEALEEIERLTKGLHFEVRENNQV